MQPLIIIILQHIRIYRIRPNLQSDRSTCVTSSLDFILKPTMHSPYSVTCISVKSTDGPITPLACGQLLLFCVIGPLARHVFIPTPIFHIYNFFTLLNMFEAREDRLIYLRKPKPSDELQQAIRKKCPNHDGKITMPES